MANILADLSLRLRANSAELSKGLENAKKQVKSFQDGITTTGKAMGEAFKSASAEIGGSLNHMTNGISGMLSSGLEMSRGLVAGITSVKTAFISTGIGAIVLAIVAAFSALTAAFKRSGEAGDAMAEVFSGIRAVIDFLIGKLVDLGEWIVKAFQSEPMQKFGSVLKDIGTRFGGFFKMVIGGFQTIINSALGASFAISGIFDKDNRAKAQEYFDKMKEGFDKIGEGAKQLWTGVNETPKGESPLAQAYKDGKALEKLRDQLADDQRAALVQNKKDEIEVAKIREEMAKLGNKTEEDRRKKIELSTKAIEIQTALTERNVSLAKRNLEIVRQENRLKNDTSDAAKDAEAAAEAAALEAEERGRQENIRFRRSISSNEDAIDMIEKKNSIEKTSNDNLLRLEKELSDLRHSNKLMEIKDAKLASEEKLKYERDSALKDEATSTTKAIADSSSEEEKIKIAQMSAEKIQLIWDEYYLKSEAAAEVFADRIRSVDKELAMLRIDESQKIAEKELSSKLKANVEAASSDEERLKLVAEYYKELALLQEQYENEAAVKQLEFNKEAELDAALSAEEKIKIEEKYLKLSQQLKDQYATDVQAVNADFGKDALDAELANTKKSYAEKLQLLKDQLDQEIILYDEYAKRKAEIDQEEKERKISIAEATQSYSNQLIEAVSNFQEARMNEELKAAGDNETKKEAIRKRYAKKQQKAAIAQTLINGAVAIIKALAELGPIAGAVAATIIGVTTASQVAAIASQPLAKGGIAYGETLATIGEYPGARSNPEVVAPLDKLQNILTKVMTESAIIDDNTFSEKNLKRAFSQNLPKTRQTYGSAKKATNMSDNVPKFADGGLVYGPTFGIVGEYPGAQSNPEIMMPLKTIGSMLAKSISTSIFNVGDTRSIESTLDTEDNNTYISNSSRNLRGLNIPKLASGGIAYGETLATVGEYAGAINNPEVIAPLDKLRDMISPITPDFGDVRFVIEQDKLVGLLTDYNNKNTYF